MSRKRKTGDRLGDWELVRELGAGGNAVVWVAKKGEQTAALKVLKSSRCASEQYTRFQQEVSALKQLSDVRGVLPLIEFSCPAGISYANPAWLVQPIATPLKDFLKDCSLTEIVSALQGIAAVLACCATREIFHRDIKPANLYSLDGVPSVGDFGLASIPDGKALTLPGRKFGPLFYLPNELLSDASEAAPGPADVFMFAKTLWVLSTGQQLPPQGQIRLEYHQSTVSSFWNDPKSSVIDSLIHDCTANDPKARPTMQFVADELAAWLDIGKTHQVATANMRVLKSRLRPIISQHLTSDEMKDRAKLECKRIWEEIEPFLVPMADQISAGTGLTSTVERSNSVNTVVTHPEKYRTKCYGPSMNVISSAIKGNHELGTLISGIGLLATEDIQTVSVIAAHAIRATSIDSGVIIWQDTREISPRTAQERLAIQELVRGLFDNLEDALEAYVNHLTILNAGVNPG